jgi:uncharacterized cupredoxin-like copper-binding protein
MKSIKTLIAASFIAVSMVGCSTAPAAAPTPAGPQVVNVSMTTYGFKFTPDKIRAGEVKFVVKNDATDLKHEMRLVKTNLAIDKLPMNSDGAQVDESSKDFTSLGAVEDVEPGKSGEMTVTLESGRYVYFCNTPAHYTLKMRGELTVAP